MAWCLSSHRFVPRPLFLVASFRSSLAFQPLQCSTSSTGQPKPPCTKRRSRLLTKGEHARLREIGLSYLRLAEGVTGLPVPVSTAPTGNKCIRHFTAPIPSNWATHEESLLLRLFQLAQCFRQLLANVFWQSSARDGCQWMLVPASGIWRVPCEGSRLSGYCSIKGQSGTGHSLRMKTTRKCLIQEQVTL